MSFYMKKKVLALSGSASKESSNTSFLKAISMHLEDQYNITIYSELREFPLFRPEDLEQELPEIILNFKANLMQADFVLISTPEYTKNIPAVLKNALDWVTASGEFQDKKVLAMTLTPKAPRGVDAMKSLLASLKGLKAAIVGEASFYKEEFTYDEQNIELNDEIVTFLKAVIE